MKPEKVYPLKERKTFVFVVYAYNQAEWVERSLRSILEQEYDYYRIVFIDDGSIDQTFDVAQLFILENQQEERTILIRNEERQGMARCFSATIDQLLDQEIVVPLVAKDWIAHSGALTRLNGIFQNPDIWTASTQGIAFPTFEPIDSGLDSFYAAVFKQIPKGNLQEGTHFYKAPLQKMAQSRSVKVPDILFISNQAL